MHLDATEQNAVLHAALNVAAVSDEGVDALAVGIHIGGAGVALLGVDGTLGAEQFGPDIALQQYITMQGVNKVVALAGGIAVPHIAAQLQLAAHLLQDVVAEAVLIMCHAVTDQTDQQVGGQDVQIQAAVALGGIDIVSGVDDAAGIVQLEVGVAALAGHRGAHAGHVGTGLHMVTQHIVQRDVDDQITVGQHHVLLTDILHQIVQHAGQSLHLAAELANAAAVLSIGKGRQQRQTAVLAAQVPALAVAQMVQHALALALHDDAHILHAGVDHIGEHEVHHAVLTADGNGAMDSVLDQLTQARLFLIREDNSVHSFHAYTP